MLESKTTPFQHALDVVEAMPDEDQEMLADIVRRRIAARRRAELEQSVREAKAEYAQGLGEKMTAEELVRKLLP